MAINLFDFNNPIANLKKTTEDLKQQNNNLSNLPNKIDFSWVINKAWYNQVWKSVWQMQQWQTTNQVLWTPKLLWNTPVLPKKQILNSKQLQSFNKPIPKPSIIDNIIPTAKADNKDITDEELTQLIKEWYSNEEIIKMVDELKQQPAPVEQSTIKDLHPNEWFLEQTWKAWLRWLKNVWLWTLESIWTLWQWATNLLSKGYQWISNTITWDNTPATQFENPYTALSNEYQWNTQKELKPTTALNDLSKYGAWLSTSAFNVVKAPLSVWLSTAGELPWTQYIMQWLSKAIEWTWKWLADITGVDEDTMHNIITTWMNTLWLKVKGWWTIETAWKMKTAFKEAPTPLKWVLNAW